MVRKHKIMIAAGILAAFSAFFATSAFTEQRSVTDSDRSAYGYGLGGLNGLTASVSEMSDRLDFRLERLETMLTAMQTAMETMIDAMVPLMEQGMEAMLKLSDDIGKMANRILLMARQIGDMSDRIVDTMVIMTDTLLAMQKTMAAMLLALQNGSNPAVAGVTATAAGVAESVRGTATLILSPSEGETLTDTTAFQLAGDHNDFILYASSDAGMANATNILVQDNALSAALARIKGYVRNNKVYVAAKAVDGGAVGDLSNTVMLFVP